MPLLRLPSSAEHGLQLLVQDNCFQTQRFKASWAGRLGANGSRRLGGVTLYHLPRCASSTSKSQSDVVHWGEEPAYPRRAMKRCTVENLKNSDTESLSLQPTRPAGAGVAPQSSQHPTPGTGLAGRPYAAGAPDFRHRPHRQQARSRQAWLTRPRQPQKRPTCSPTSAYARRKRKRARAHTQWISRDPEGPVDVSSRLSPGPATALLDARGGEGGGRYDSERDLVW